jgi:uncharacterized protein with HEPN domain
VLSRSFADRIQDMLKEVAEIEQFVEGMSFEEFCEDQRTLKAVLYCLAIIGEAAASLLPEASTRYSEIPWIDIRGMRNIAIHEYFQIDLEIVWETVQGDLPQLKRTLTAVLQAELG